MNKLWTKCEHFVNINVNKKNERPGWGRSYEIQFLKEGFLFFKEPKKGLRFAGFLIIIFVFILKNNSQKKERG